MDSEQHHSAFTRRVFLSFVGMALWGCSRPQVAYQGSDFVSNIRWNDCEHVALPEHWTITAAQRLAFTIQYNQSNPPAMLDERTVKVPSLWVWTCEVVDVDQKIISSERLRDDLNAGIETYDDKITWQSPLKPKNLAAGTLWMWSYQRPQPSGEYTIIIKVYPTAVQYDVGDYVDWGPGFEVAYKTISVQEGAIPVGAWSFQQQKIGNGMQAKAWQALMKATH